MKYVFISPHIDDAFLSAGGLIFELLKESRSVQIQYIFTISNWTNSSSISNVSFEKNTELITAIRKAEEKKINDLLSYDCHHLDFLDFPLRPQDAKSNNILMREIEDHFRRTISKDDCWFFPLALEHPDHILIREIGEKFLREGYNIIFYEDMPYMSFGKYQLHNIHNHIQKRGLLSSSRKINFKKNSGAI